MAVPNKTDTQIMKYNPLNPFINPPPKVRQNPPERRKKAQDRAEIIAAALRRHRIRDGLGCRSGPLPLDWDVIASIWENITGRNYPSAQTIQERWDKRRLDRAARKALQTEPGWCIVGRHGSSCGIATSPEEFPHDFHLRMRWETLRSGQCLLVNSIMAHQRRVEKARDALKAEPIEI